MKKKLSVSSIDKSIFLIRGYRVMLDRDLAGLYGVTTKRLNQQFKRNRDRFPDDFAFQLTLNETKTVPSSRLQIATLNRGGNTKYAPHVFTEHGAVMLASVLNSPIAVQASIEVVRAFVRLRRLIASHRDLALKLAELEQKCDRKFRTVFETLRELMEPPPVPRRRFIGFKPTVQGRKPGR